VISIVDITCLSLEYASLLLLLLLVIAFAAIFYFILFEFMLLMSQLMGECWRVMLASYPFL